MAGTGMDTDKDRQEPVPDKGRVMPPLQLPSRSGSQRQNLDNPTRDSSFLRDSNPIHGPRMHGRDRAHCSIRHALRRHERVCTSGMVVSLSISPFS